MGTFFTGVTIVKTVNNLSEIMSSKGKGKTSVPQLPPYLKYFFLFIKYFSSPQQVTGPGPGMVGVVWALVSLSAAAPTAGLGGAGLLGKLPALAAECVINTAARRVDGWSPPL